MRHKIILLLAALVLVVAMAVPAFADTATDAKTWFEQRFAAKKAAVDQAVRDGRLTEAQGEQIKDHFDTMYEFHQENGFTCPMGYQGMMGAAGGNCPFGNQGQGPRGGFGGQGMGFGRMMQQNNVQSQ